MEIEKQTVTEEELMAKRQRCEVWTRVMGYMRPLSQWNLGKKSEGYSREYFDIDVTNASFDGYTASNEVFCEKY